MRLMLAQYRREVGAVRACIASGDLEGAMKHRDSATGIACTHGDYLGYDDVKAVIIGDFLPMPINLSDEINDAFHRVPNAFEYMIREGRM